MTLSQFRARRLTMAAQKAEADLLVASLGENVQYVSGYYCINLDVLQRTESYALFRPSDGAVTIVGSIAELPSILEAVGMEAEVYCYGSFRFAGTAGDPLTERLEQVKAERCWGSLSQALSAAILASGAKRVALDESRCSVTTWNALAAACPGVELFPGSQVFMEARLVKHQEEIAGIERSAEIAEEALAFALKDFRVGMTEKDLERRFREELARQDAGLLFFVGTAAHRAAYSDTQNTDLAIQAGDMIRFDFGCIWQGYRSDLARTAVVGAADEKVAAYYEAVRLGTRDAIAAIKPGVTAEEIFNIAVESTRKNGIPHYERHHCGHGIGVECYDRPSVAPGDTTVLEEGMTLNVETPYYELGWGGVQMESTVVVTREGCRYLDKSGDALIVLEG